MKELKESGQGTTEANGSEVNDAAVPTELDEYSRTLEEIIGGIDMFATLKNAQDAREQFKEAKKKEFDDMILIKTTRGEIAETEDTTEMDSVSVSTNEPHVDTAAIRGYLKRKGEFESPPGKRTYYSPQAETTSISKAFLHDTEVNRQMHILDNTTKRELKEVDKTMHDEKLKNDLAIANIHREIALENAQRNVDIECIRAEANIEIERCRNANLIEMFKLMRESK